MRRYARVLLIVALLVGGLTMLAPSSEAGLFRRGRGFGGYRYGGTYVYRPAWGYGYGAYRPYGGYGYGGYGLGYSGYGYGLGYPGYYGMGYPGYLGGYGYPGYYGTSVSIGTGLYGGGVTIGSYPW